CSIAFAGEDKHEVTRLGTELLRPHLQIVGAVELVNRRLQSAVSAILHINKPFRANLWTFYKFGQLVDLFSRIVGTSFRADPNNNLGTFKDSKVLSFRLLRDLSELHIEARVRFVGAVVAHCILIRHARNRGKVNSLDSLEQVANETFKQI